MEHNRPIGELSSDELIAYADTHVLYEITQFLEAAHAVDAATRHVFPMNFAIEVFALHLRNLLDFFAPRNARRTDARAAVFCRSWKAPGLNSFLEEARWMADKQVAHLTTSRTEDIDLKVWAVEPILHSILPLIERFALEAELVSEHFREQVADRIAEAPRRKEWSDLPPQRSVATSLERSF